MVAVLIQNQSYVLSTVLHMMQHGNGIKAATVTSVNHSPITAQGHKIIRSRKVCSMQTIVRILGDQTVFSYQQTSSYCSRAKGAGYR